MTTINSRVVLVIRCSPGLIKGTKDKLRAIVRKNWKTMTMHTALHPQADVDRLYIPRNNGGRGMISFEDCMKMETESLKKYVENSNERLLKTVEGEGILGYGKTKKKFLENRRNSLMEKPLHSEFMGERVEVRSQETWNRP